MELLMEMYCTYCGMAQGDRIQCCSENHWQTAQEFKEYHGEWPEGDEDHQERRDAAPDYRTAEQYYADLAHEQKRKHLAGED
jgi:hypothetical protein